MKQFVKAYYRSLFPVQKRQNQEEDNGQVFCLLNTTDALEQPTTLWLLKKWTKQNIEECVQGINI